MLFENTKLNAKRYVKHKNYIGPNLKFLHIIPIEITMT